MTPHNISSSANRKHEKQSEHVIAVGENTILISKRNADAVM